MEKDKLKELIVSLSDSLIEAGFDFMDKAEEFNDPHDLSVYFNLVISGYVSAMFSTLNAMATGVEQAEKDVKEFKIKILSSIEECKRMRIAFNEKLN
jgi:hypothetical protein